MTARGLGLQFWVAWWGHGGGRRDTSGGGAEASPFSAALEPSSSFYGRERRSGLAPDPGTSGSQMRFCPQQNICHHILVVPGSDLCKQENKPAKPVIRFQWSWEPLFPAQSLGALGSQGPSLQPQGSCASRGRWPVSILPFSFQLHWALWPPGQDSTTSPFACV